MMKARISRLMVLAIILGIAQMFLGCSESNVDRSSLPTSSGGSPAAPDGIADMRSPATAEVAVAGTMVQLIEAHLGALGDTVFIAYDFTGETGTLSERNMMMSLSRLDNDGAKYEISTWNLEGELRFKISTWSDSTMPSSFWMTESTTEDSLTLFRTVAGDQVTESYTFNGLEYEVTFTSVEIEAFFTQQTQAVTNERVAPSDDNGIAPAHRDTQESVPSFNNMNKFERLALVIDQSSSLFDNEDGEIMVALLESSDFLDWLSDQLDIPAGSSKEIHPTVKKICELAAFVATVKCTLGGPLNPVCVGALGVVGACAIVYAFDLLKDVWSWWW